MGAPFYLCAGLDVANLKKGRYGSAQKGDGWATPEYYGAKGNLGDDDSPAFNTALADLGGAGGRLLLGPRQYRLDERLVMPSNVSIAGVPDASYLVSNHATEPGLVFLGYNEGPPVSISDVRFVGNVVNTGNCITNNSDARVQFMRCSWNGYNLGVPSDNLRGKIASQGSSGSKLDFIDCDIRVAGNVRGIDVTAGHVGIARGSMVMPGTYGEALVYASGTADVEMAHTYVDTSLHSVSAGKVLLATGGSVRSRMLGCKVEASSASTCTGFWWEEGSNVLAQDNMWSNMSGVFVPYATNLAASGSYADLLPTLAVDVGSAAVVNSAWFGTRAYSSIIVKNNYTSPTTISLPPGIYPGQVLHFTYNNSAVSAQTVSFSGTPVTAQALPGSGTLGAGNTLTSTFVWESRDINFSYRWIQKGGWGVGLTLA